MASCVSCQCIKQLNHAKNAFYLITKRKKEYCPGAYNTIGLPIQYHCVCWREKKELNTIFRKMIFIAYNSERWKIDVNCPKLYKMNFSFSFRLCPIQSIFTFMNCFWWIQQPTVFALSYSPMDDSDKMKRNEEVKDQIKSNGTKICLLLVLLKSPKWEIIRITRVGCKTHESSQSKLPTNRLAFMHLNIKITCDKVNGVKTL